EVVVDPAPARLTAHTDFYGNSSTYLLVDSPHTRLDVHSHAQVTVAERRYLLEPMSRPWEQCLPEHWRSLLPAAGPDFVHPSPRPRARLPRRARRRAARSARPWPPSPRCSAPTSPPPPPRPPSPRRSRRCSPRGTGCARTSPTWVWPRCAPPGSPPGTSPATC